MRSGWMWAIAGVIVLSAAGALGLLIASSVLQTEAQAYFSSFDYSETSSIEIDPVKDEYYNVLSTRGSQLYTAAMPLLQVAIAGPLVLLAVLSAGRDARPRRVATGQTEALAAS